MKITFSPKLMEIAMQMMEEGKNEADARAAQDLLDIQQMVDALHIGFRAGNISREQMDAANALNRRLVREYQEVEDLYRAATGLYAPEEKPMIAGNKNNVDAILDWLWMDFQGIHANVLIRNKFIEKAADYIEAVE